MKTYYLYKLPSKIWKIRERITAEGENITIEYELHKLTMKDRISVNTSHARVIGDFLYHRTIVKGDSVELTLFTTKSVLVYDIDFKRNKIKLTYGLENNITTVKPRFIKASTKAVAKAGAVYDSLKLKIPKDTFIDMFVKKKLGLPSQAFVNEINTTYFIYTVYYSNSKQTLYDLVYITDDFKTGVLRNVPLPIISDREVNIDIVINMLEVNLFNIKLSNIFSLSNDIVTYEAAISL